MQIPIQSVADLGIAIRAVRKEQGLRGLVTAALVQGANHAGLAIEPISGGRSLRGGSHPDRSHKGVTALIAGGEKKLASVPDRGWWTTRRAILINSSYTTHGDNSMKLQIGSVAAMQAQDAAAIRAQFAPSATQAYGADGKMKDPVATAKWLESDIIKRQGKVADLRGINPLTGCSLL